jgi:cell division protein FtsN
MAKYERDKDDVRAFDGGEDDDAEGSHLPVVIIIAILVLAAFGGVVWLAYNQGVARGRSDVPVQIAAADTHGTGGQIKVFQQPAGAEDEENVQTAPANPDAVPAAPKSELKVADATPVAAPPPAALAAVKPQPKPAAPATKPPAQLGLAHPVEQAPPAPAATKPAKPVATVVPKPVATVVPKPVETKPVAAASGSYLLQVGAYKSEDEAMSAWKTYQAKHVSLLRGFSPDVQRADLGDKGVWYRLRVSSFADKNAASALCDRLKTENGVCFLAR